MTDFETMKSIFDKIDSKYEIFDNGHKVSLELISDAYNDTMLFLFDENGNLADYE